MTKNIKNIDLWKGEKNYNGIPLVRINFEFPCTWTVLELEDLKTILKLWIEGEEERYPQEKGYRGRWMLFDEIEKIFKEEKNNE
jgi:hypothetical protein